MANRYEKLDQFLNDAFRGSPNTLEANETKIEIITNLRQMYDELIESGMSEEEALTKACDSLGNPAEIFGSMDGAGRSTGGAGYFNRGGDWDIRTESSAPDKRSVHPKKPPASPFRPLVITLGVLLCALCWLPTVILAVNGVTEHGWIAAPVLGSVALGVLCFIYAGCMRIGVSAKTRLHYFFIGLGVACEIACAVPILLYAELNEGLALSLLFTLIAAGIVLIVMGAMIPTDKWDNDEVEKKETKSPLDKSISLMIVAIYLLLSFMTGAWAVTWLVFLIGSAVRTLISAILDLNEHKEGHE